MKNLPFKKLILPISLAVTAVAVIISIILVLTIGGNKNNNNSNNDGNSTSDSANNGNGEDEDSGSSNGSSSTDICIHMEVIDQAQNPTCTESGLTEGKHCSECGEILIKQETVSALSHNLTSYAAKEPTCTDAGYKAYETCGRTDCSYTTYEEIPALTHDLTSYAAKEPTCTDAGYKAYETCGRTDCSYTTYEEIPALTHDLTSYAAKEPTCTDAGYKAYETCGRTDCSYTTYEEAPALDHDFSGGAICALCSYMIYSRINYEENKDENGTYILFGSYPQSKVSDISVQAALNSLTGELPTYSDSYGWNSYKYYISSSNNFDYMWYIDVESDGDKYRGVYFTSYRPTEPKNSSITSKTYQDDNGYLTNTVYWFKYEPIKWRILTENDGKALIYCDMIIDAQAYQDFWVHDGNNVFYATDSNGTILTDENGNKIYANNYNYSKIRAWLNDNFYNTAFDSLQKELINLTVVDNSKESIKDAAGTIGVMNGSDALYENTNDNIFLLSEKEITTPEYGFAGCDVYDTERQKQTTDYAQSQGARTYFGEQYDLMGWYWLRSPSSSGSLMSATIDSQGYAKCGMNPNQTAGGVCPALWIILN